MRSMFRSRPEWFYVSLSGRSFNIHYLNYIMSRFRNYLSLVKFSHTLFALPFAMIGFFLGIFGRKFIGEENVPGTEILYVRFALVLVCMVTARSAAMAFNRYLDRLFDARNPRTAIREIPRGIIAPNNALRFVVICCIIFMITC